MSTYVFDTETTGSGEHDQVIEAAVLRIDNPVNWQVTAEWGQRFRPSVPISLGALATHHIFEEELVKKQPSEEFKVPLDTQYIVGHNVDFDWRMAGSPDVKRICTLALARFALPDLDSHSQVALAYYFNPNDEMRTMVRNAHSASVDVEVCRVNAANLCDVLESQGHDVSTWEKLHEVSEIARVPKVMPFGKHKGEAIESLPADYKRWLLSQDWLDEYMRKALV